MNPFSVTSGPLVNFNFRPRDARERERGGGESSRGKAILFSLNQQRGRILASSRELLRRINLQTARAPRGRNKRGARASPKGLIFHIHERNRGGRAGLKRSDGCCGMGYTWPNSARCPRKQRRIRMKNIFPAEFLIEPTIFKFADYRGRGRDRP